jgi:uncharacterized UPF0160 family protein
MDTIIKNTIHIVTHDGSFHADEIFAIATLCIVHKDKNIRITRTRDRNIVDIADIVVDVGGIYDTQSKRFDHHQKEGAGERPNTIPYASFGIVWKQYGESITEDPYVADAIDTTLVQPIDALDNGITIGEYKSFYGDMRPYDISDVINSFKPLRNDDDEAIYNKFMYLVEMAKMIIISMTKSIKDIKDNDDELKDEILKNKDKTLLILDKYYYTNNIGLLSNTVLLSISKKKDGTWIVESVRDNPKSFENRIKFPVEWLGKRDKELQNVTGVEDAIFCHKGGFMIVTGSKESAIIVAHKILRYAHVVE